LPDKQIRMTRSRMPDAARPRPVMLAIGGDSASGKTTLATGLVEAIGSDRCTAICVDDYHRFDRAERRVLPLLTKLSRACFDISVFLDPPEEIRQEWKIKRDTSKRGYTREQVLGDLERREPESAEFIRPQRRHADIVVRFAPVATRADAPGTPLSAELLLRPTIAHPPLSHVLTDDHRTAMHLKIIRDNDGTPVDCLHVHGHANHDEIQMLQKEIWAGVAGRREMPEGLGAVGPGERSEPLAMTQLLLLYHLMQEV